MRTFELSLWKDLHEEICCDDCGETIHTHINCPICKNAYAGTDCFGSLINEYHNNFLKDNKFCCHECETEFEIIKIENGFMYLKLANQCSQPCDQCEIDPTPDNCKYYTIKKED